MQHTHNNVIINKASRRSTSTPAASGVGGGGVRLTLVCKNKKEATACSSLSTSFACYKILKKKSFKMIGFKFGLENATSLFSVLQTEAETDESKCK